jgi:hypothetical protein
MCGGGAGERELAMGVAALATPPANLFISGSLGFLHLWKKFNISCIFYLFILEICCYLRLMIFC